MKKLIATLFICAFFFAAQAGAETLVWRGPTHTITIGLAEEDIAHVEFPEEIINITMENNDYVDILVVEGYANRAFRMRSLLPKMATRVFFTGASGKTYIAILTTDVPYRAFIQVADGTLLEDIARKAASKFDENDLIRAMASDSDIPGILRETYVIPSWFKGGGLAFDLAEVWQTSLLTGLVVQVKNELDGPNEANLPAITIPQTDEWGILYKAAMENMRLAPRGKAGDRGVLYLVFKR